LDNPIKQAEDSPESSAFFMGKPLFHTTHTTDRTHKESGDAQSLARRRHETLLN
jgi:hypothetical protein